MNFGSMRDELLKIAEEVSGRDALKAIKRLRDLEKTKPTAGEIGRGALAGGVAGTSSTLARGLVSGDVVKGLKGALQAPTLAGKAGRVLHGAARGLGTSMAGSAAFGSTLPFVRRYLDREAEKAVLRDYLGHTKGGKVRRKVKRTLGV